MSTPVPEPTPAWHDGLEALIPRVQDAQVRADLALMPEAHRRNIGRVGGRHA